MTDVYEKPKMTFVSLYNKENIAEKCWGNHGTGVKYYDTVGEGYVSFSIPDGSCTMENGLIMVYYKDQNDPGTPIYEGNQYYDEVYNKILTTSNGSWGQSFKGEKLFPDDPSGMS